MRIGDRLFRHDLGVGFRTILVVPSSVARSGSSRIRGGGPRRRSREWTEATGGNDQEGERQDEGERMGCSCDRGHPVTFRFRVDVVGSGALADLGPQRKPGLAGGQPRAARRGGSTARPAVTRIDGSALRGVAFLQSRLYLPKEVPRCALEPLLPIQRSSPSVSPWPAAGLRWRRQI